MARSESLQVTSENGKVATTLKHLNGVGPIETRDDNVIELQDCSKQIESKPQPESQLEPQRKRAAYVETSLDNLSYSSGDEASGQSEDEENERRLIERLKLENQQRQMRQLELQQQHQQQQQQQQHFFAGANGQQESQVPPVCYHGAQQLQEDQSDKEDELEDREEDAEEEEEEGERDDDDDDEHDEHDGDNDKAPQVPIRRSSRPQTQIMQDEVAQQQQQQQQYLLHQRRLARAAAAATAKVPVPFGYKQAAHFCMAGHEPVPPAPPAALKRCSISAGQQSLRRPALPPPPPPPPAGAARHLHPQQTTAAAKRVRPPPPPRTHSAQQAPKNIWSPSSSSMVSSSSPSNGEPEHEHEDELRGLRPAQDSLDSMTSTGGGGGGSSSLSLLRQGTGAGAAAAAAGTVPVDALGSPSGRQVAQFDSYPSAATSRSNEIETIVERHLDSAELGGDKWHQRPTGEKRQKIATCDDNDATDDAEIMLEAQRQSGRGDEQAQLEPADRCTGATAIETRDSGTSQARAQQQQDNKMSNELMAASESAPGGSDRRAANWRSYSVSLPSQAPRPEPQLIGLDTGGGSALPGANHATTTAGTSGLVPGRSQGRTNSVGPMRSFSIAATAAPKLNNGTNNDNTIGRQQAAQQVSAAPVVEPPTSEACPKRAASGSVPSDATATGTDKALGRHQCFASTAGEPMQLEQQQQQQQQQQQRQQLQRKASGGGAGLISGSQPEAQTTAKRASDEASSASQAAAALAIAPTAVAGHGPLPPPPPPPCAPHSSPGSAFADGDVVASSSANNSRQQAAFHELSPSSADLVGTKKRRATEALQRELQVDEAGVGGKSELRELQPLDGKAGVGKIINPQTGPPNAPLLPSSAATRMILGATGDHKHELDADSADKTTGMARTQELHQYQYEQYEQHKHQQHREYRQYSHQEQVESSSRPDANQVRAGSKQVQDVGAPAGEVPSSSMSKQASKEEWFKQMYKQMHKPTVSGERSILDVVNAQQHQHHHQQPQHQQAQDESGLIKIKLKSPRSDHRQDPSYFDERDLGRRSVSPVFVNGAQKPGNICDYLPGQSSISQHERNLQQQQQTRSGPQTPAYHVRSATLKNSENMATSDDEHDKRCVFTRLLLQDDKDNDDNRQRQPRFSGRGTNYFQTSSLDRNTAASVMRDRTRGQFAANEYEDDEDDNLESLTRLARDESDPHRQYVAVQQGQDIPLKGLRKPAPQPNIYKDHMFDEKSINIHYRAPTSRLLKMNTLNEFELNRIKKFYAQELASRLHRSKSTRLTAAQPNTCYWQTSGGAAAAPAAAASTSAHRDSNLVPSLDGQLRAAGPRSGLDVAELESGTAVASTNVVDLKRYQHALSSKQKGRRQRAQHQGQHKACGPRFGRALYNFQAKNEGELSLKCGDLVELLDILDGASWARVEDCQSGLQGLVPVSYLDLEVGCAVAKRDVGSSSSRSSSRLSQADLTPEIATTPASLSADQLLPMSKGEPIALIRKLSGHLYEASNTRLATGLVWSNDLEIIKQPGAWADSTCQCKRGSANVTPLRAPGDSQQRRPAGYRRRAATGETLMVTDECLHDADLGSLDEGRDIKAYSGGEQHYRGGEGEDGEDDDDNDEEDDDEDEITRYLNQLQSICTDLSASKRRQHQHRVVTLEREVPLLRDSSQAKRRRARSASAALDLLHQEQRHLHQEQQHQQQHARHQRDRHQYHQSSRQQRHYEHQVEETMAAGQEAGYDLHPSRHRQVLPPTAPVKSDQYRGQKYCACCTQQKSDDLHQACEHSAERSLDRAGQRQPPRSSSSPHIVSATDRLQQQQQQGAELDANTAPVVNSNLPRLCRARFAYKPRQRDELELVVGDILVVVQECDDGWFIGSSYTTKQMGTFPGNFVESI